MRVNQQNIKDDDIMVKLNKRLFENLKTWLCVYMYCKSQYNKQHFHSATKSNEHENRCLLELLSLCILWMHVCWRIFDPTFNFALTWCHKKTELALKSCMLQSRWLDAVCFNPSGESLLTIRFYHPMLDLKEKEM